MILVWQGVSAAGSKVFFCLFSQLLLQIYKVFSNYKNII